MPISAEVIEPAETLLERVQFADWQHELHLHIYEALCACVPAELTQTWSEKLELWEANREVSEDPSEPKRSRKFLLCLAGANVIDPFP